jgi:hypothetical protein
MAIPILLLTACNAGTSRKSDRPDRPDRKEAVDVPVFSADSAFSFVAAQVAFGPRVPGSESHLACANWLTEKMADYADTVIRQPFRTRLYNKNAADGLNIIGIFNPGASKRILLAAHWDTRPFADHDPDPANHRKPIDGANDGASGVGVLLEIARQLSLQPIHKNLGIDIVFFDLEDYGPPTDERQQGDDDFWALGSQHWARNPHIKGYHARFGILLDMVGARGAVFPREYFSQQYASWVLDKAWRTAFNLGYGDYFVNKPGPPITDDHLPVNRIAGIPMINIIHLDTGSPNGSFFAHWHTMNDNIEQIDPKTLGMVGEVVVHVVYAE